MIQKLWGERKPGFVSNLISGFLFLLLLFVPCLLYALKKDLGLSELKRIYVAVALVIVAACLIITVADVLKGRIKFRLPHFDKGNVSAWIFLVAAGVLGIISFFCLTPSFVNDDTWEIVETTLLHGKIYEYSSFTGLPLETGLPIFCKVYIMPMFYSVVCSALGTDLFPIAGIIVPLLVYCLHLWLVYRISEELLAEKLRFPFMTVYLMVLAAGTYLPENGIPVTAGYAILREGYSGYAICYGLVLPMCLWCILKRRWVKALVTGATAMGLVRIDRVYFGLRELIKSGFAINGSGKLFFLFVICIIALIVLRKRLGETIRWYGLFIPSVTIAYTAVVLWPEFKTGRDRIVYALGVCAIVFACCDYKPFDGGEWGFLTRTHRDVKECSTLIPEGARVLSTKEFMEKIRRVDGSISTAVSRANYTPELTGLDFEEPLKHNSDYLLFAENYSFWVSAYAYSAYEGYITLYELTEIAKSEGINTIVIPASRNESEEKYSFTDAGFEYLGDKGGYSVYYYGGETEA